MKKSKSVSRKKKYTPMDSLRIRVEKLKVRSALLDLKLRVINSCKISFTNTEVQEIIDEIDGQYK